MLKIGDFSRLARVTVKALRYYDDIGLLKPDFINEENGYRYYQPDQLRIFSEILTYKNLGFSIEEILFLIKENPSPSDIYGMLMKKKSQIQNVVATETSRLKSIDTFIQSLEEVQNMETVRIKELPEVIVASFRTVIPAYNALHQVAPAMGEKMKQQGAQCRVPEYCFNIYHDEEYKESDIDVEICEAVVKKLPDQDGIVYKIMPGIKTAACLYHRGAYENLGKSYAIILNWIEENGYEAVAHSRESYIDGCWNKDNVDDWLTEIQIPIQKT